MRCPRDGEALRQEAMLGVALQGCVRCGGLLVPAERIATLFSSLGLGAPGDALSRGETVGCPACSARMHGFAHAGFLVDRCSKCKALWLDKGELTRMKRPGAPPAGDRIPLERSGARYTRRQLLGAAGWTAFWIAAAALVFALDAQYRTGRGWGGPHMSVEATQIINLGGCILGWVATTTITLALAPDTLLSWLFIVLIVVAVLMMVGGPAIAYYFF